MLPYRHLIYNIATGAFVRYVDPGFVPNPSVGEASFQIPGSARTEPPLTEWNATVRGFVEIPPAPVMTDDDWTYVVLGTNFGTTGTSSVDVTGLAFTPVASSKYEIEGKLLVQAAATTTGPRPGVKWPTGLSDGGAVINAPNSLTASVVRHAQAGSAQRADATGIGIINVSFVTTIDAIMLTGASPSGAFQVTLASEINASAARIMAGSFIRYRRY